MRCAGESDCYRIPVSYLKEQPDPQMHRRCAHELVNLLMIALYALLCRAESFDDMDDFSHVKHAWFETFLSLRHGIPLRDTFKSRCAGRWTWPTAG